MITAGSLPFKSLFVLLQELLGEMHSSGKLTSLSLWKELFPLIDKDNRYHDMLGQPGKWNFPCLLGYWIQVSFCMQSR